MHNYDTFIQVCRLITCWAAVIKIDAFKNLLYTKATLINRSTTTCEFRARTYMTPEQKWQLPYAFYDTDVSIGLTICRVELRTSLTTLAGFSMVFERQTSSPVLCAFGLKLKAGVQQLLSRSWASTFPAQDLSDFENEQVHKLLGHNLQQLLDEILQDLLQLEQTVLQFQADQLNVLSVEQSNWTTLILTSLERMRSIATMANNILVPRLIPTNPNS